MRLGGLLSDDYFPLAQSFHVQFVASSFFYFLLIKGKSLTPNIAKTIPISEDSCVITDAMSIDPLIPEPIVVKIGPIAINKAAHFVLD